VTPPPAIQVENLNDALRALSRNASAGQPVHLLFSWASLRAAGIGYALAIVAKARATYPQIACRSVLDAGEDAGLALSALKSGADMVRFSGAPQLAQKLSQIALQLGVGIEVTPVIL
jgi:predicted nicotinamide N-methyase